MSPTSQRRNQTRCAFTSEPTSATAAFARSRRSGSGRQTTEGFLCWLGINPACQVASHLEQGYAVSSSRRIYRWNDEFEGGTAVDA